VKNLTHETQPYVVRFSLDEVYGEGSAKPTFAKIYGQVINLSALPQGTKVSREANTILFEHPVQIPAGNAINAELMGYQMMAEEEVWPWHLFGISDSVEITVSYPGDFLDVWLLPKHPSKPTPADFGMITNPGLIKASIDDIIVSYQGFEIKWKPKQSPPRGEPTLASAPPSEVVGGHEDKK
jgi:hypothetical protein